MFTHLSRRLLTQDEYRNIAARTMDPNVKSTLRWDEPRTVRAWEMYWSLIDRKLMALQAHWNFDAGLVGTSLDSATNTCADFHGAWEFHPGVGGGRALRFDGFTTFIARLPGTTLALGRAFTVEAWVMLGAYPWNDCPIIDLTDTDAGLFFGIDDHGGVVVRARLGDEWVERRSESLDLRSWHHVAATVKANALTLYIDGELISHVKAEEDFVAAADPGLLIGRTRSAMKPTGGIRPDSHAEGDIYLDGLLDEIKVHDETLSVDAIADAFAATTIPDTCTLPERRLPSGPPGKGRFGAYYTRLNYYDAWDRRWRVGDHPDIVVRFDNEAYRFVFWRGTNYVPCWATENGIWYTNEFNETWGHGSVGCIQPSRSIRMNFRKRWSCLGRASAPSIRFTGTRFSHRLEVTRYGIQQGLSHDFSPPLSYRLGTKISVQSAARRSADAGARDHPPGLRRPFDVAQEGVKIINGALSRDHVHMFVEIPPHIWVSDFVRRAKPVLSEVEGGRSSRKIQPRVRAYPQAPLGTEVLG